MDNSIQSILQSPEDDIKRPIFEIKRTPEPTKTYTHWVNPNKYVEISVNPESIRTSFVQLAVESGQDETTARNFINEIPITLIEEEPEDIISKMTNKDSNKPLARVSFDPQTEAVTNLLLNIPQITRCSSPKSKKPLTHPKRNGGPDEIYIREILNVVWKHEASHLIDMMDPLHKAEIFTASNKTAQHKRIVQIPTTLATILLIGTEINQVHNNKLQIALAGITIIGTTITTAIEIQHGFYSEHEKRADEKTMKTSPNYKSPFNINFYDYNGPEV